MSERLFDAEHLQDPSVRDLARRLTGSRSDDADDLLHDAFLGALVAPEEVRTPRTWLRTVVRRIWWRRVMRERERVPREQRRARVEAGEATDSLVERAQLERLVREAVFDLPEIYSRMIVMRFFEDLPVREIARREGIPSETVRTRIKRGLARLRNALDSGVEKGCWSASRIRRSSTR